MTLTLAACSAAPPPELPAGDAGAREVPELPADGAGAREDGGEVEALIARLKLKDERPEVHRGLLARGPEVVPILVDHLHDEDFEVRWEIVQLLGTLLDPQAVPALVRSATHDQDPRLRWQCLGALGRYPDHAPAVALLRRELEADDEAVRWNAAVGLSMFGVADGLPLLHAGVGKGDPWHRWQAINALGRVHDETTSRVLGAVLVSPLRDHREEAVLSLGRVGDYEAFLFLVSALKDRAPGVRWRACLALGRLGMVEAILPLYDLKAKETDEQVLRHAEKAILRLEALL